MVPECVKIVPGSSQGALGTSQLGLVALLGHPNCRLEGSWGCLGSSLGPLGGVLGPRWPPFWRLGGSPGLLFGGILLLRQGFAAKTVKSLILMSLSSELLTFRGLGGVNMRSTSLLRALGAPLDVKMDLLGATGLPKREFWRLRGPSRTRFSEILRDFFAGSAGILSWFVRFRRNVAGIHRQPPELTLRGFSGVRRSRGANQISLNCLLIQLLQKLFSKQRGTP